MARGRRPDARPRGAPPTVKRSRPRKVEARAARHPQDDSGCLCLHTPPAPIIPRAVGGDTGVRRAVTWAGLFRARRGARTVHPPSPPAWPDCWRPLASPRVRSRGAGQWLPWDGVAGVGGGGEKVARAGAGFRLGVQTSGRGCAPGRAAWPLQVVGPRAAGLGLRERRLRHKSLRVPPSSFLPAPAPLPLSSAFPSPPLPAPGSSPSCGWAAGSGGAGGAREGAGTRICR